MVVIATTFGALLVGGFVAIFMSGTVAVQSYLYFKSFPGDSRRTKVLVGVIWLLDILHTIFVCASLWHELIAEYGQPQTIDVIPTTLALSIACTAILTFCVHCFFAQRIYTFSRGNFNLTAVVLVLAVFRLCAASVTTGEMIRLKSFRAYKARYRWVFTLGLSLSSSVDVLITASLCYFLRASRTRSSKLNSIIDSLLIYTFENGAVTCAATITSMIFWLVMSNNLIFMGLHFVIGKFYATSFLATLHARRQLRKRSSESSHGSGFAAVTFLSERIMGHRNVRIPPGQTFPSVTESTPASPTSMPGEKTQMEISVLKTVECTIEEGSGEGSTAVDSTGSTIKKEEFATYSRKGDLESGAQ